MTPSAALEQFKAEIPALGLLGSFHYVKPTDPIEITPEVQLVCKYLKAYDTFGKNGTKVIDRLYPRGKLNYD